jgi:hypothetical protein
MTIRCPVAIAGDMIVVKRIEADVTVTTTRAAYVFGRSREGRIPGSGSRRPPRRRGVGQPASQSS